MDFFKKFFKKKAPDVLESFKVHQESEGAFDAKDKGICQVPLSQIVGSVGRYHDFDKKFRPTSDHHSERLEHVKNAIKSGKILPPVSLYQIKDNYYIMDGNHRVAAAKALGRESIRARILEFFPTRKTLENVLYREKSVFMEKTGLSKPIHLTEVGQYAYLLKQIQDHQAFLETSFKRAAQDWQETIFYPFMDIIQQSHLPDDFPGRTLMDLYAYISFNQWEQAQKRQYGIELDHVIPTNMEEFRARMTEGKAFEFPEMKRLITAFVLINVKAGEEYQLMEKIFALNEVKEIYDVPGEFDLIVKIVMERNWLSSDSEVIGYFVYKTIRKLEGVVKTQTLIPTSSKKK